MSKEAQAQADSTENLPVVDPLDSTDSTNRGTNPVSAYEAELASILEVEDEPETLGDPPADEDSAAEEAEEEVADEATEDEDTPEEAEPETSSKRFRFADPVDQAVAAIAKAKGVSLVDAAKIYEGQNPSPVATQESSASEPVETVASVTATIEELRSKKRESLAALEFETAAEIDAQIDALRDKRDDLKVSELRKEQETRSSAEARYLAEFEQFEDQAIRFYPDAAKADSPLAKEMMRLDAKMRELGDPLYTDPSKPLVLAKAAAKNLRIPMADLTKTAPKKAATQNRPMQPASGNARTTAAAPAGKLDEAIERAGKSILDYEKVVASLTA